jgi:hypothetical protein
MNNSIKLTLINFLIFVYNQYIFQDWSCVNKTGRFILKPFWFIRAFLMWSIILIFFPVFYLRFKYNDKLIFVKNEINSIIKESLSHI